MSGVTTKRMAGSARTGWEGWQKMRYICMPSQGRCSAAQHHHMCLRLAQRRQWCRFTGPSSRTMTGAGLPAATAPLAVVAATVLQRSWRWAPKTLSLNAFTDRELRQRAQHTGNVRATTTSRSVRGVHCGPGLPRLKDALQTTIVIPDNDLHQHEMRDQQRNT